MTHQFREEIELYGSAFLTPARERWGYLPRWNRSLGDDHIEGIHRRILGKLQSDGPSPRGLFLLAMLFKHCQQPNLYMRCIQDVLAHFPNHLEARIAARDGHRYADPYYFPDWEDYSTGKVEFSQAIVEHRNGPGIFLEQARIGLDIVPVVVIKKDPSTFRTKVDQSTHVHMDIDIVAVVPGFEALMYAMPVVFDDDEDPYWSLTYLAPYLDGLTIQGQAVTHFGPTVDLPACDIPYRLCDGNGRCAVLVLDMSLKTILAKNIKYKNRQVARLAQIRDLLPLLRDSVELASWSQYSDIHRKNFSSIVERTDGDNLRIPAGRPVELSRLFFPIVADGDRLRVQSSDSVCERGVRETAYEIFVSHAHIDQTMVTAFVEWVEAIWSDIRIYRTLAHEAEKFEVDPGFFIRALNESYCMIIFATAAGINRPAVKLELGAAVDHPKRVVLAADGSLDGLAAAQESGLFCKLEKLPVESIQSAEGCEKLISWLAATLGREPPRTIPTLALPAQKIYPTASAPPNAASDAFPDDFSRIFAAAMPESVESQRSVVNQVLEQVYRQLPAAERRPYVALTGMFSPEFTLMFVLAGSKVGDRGIEAILERIHVLVTEELQAQVHATWIEATSEHEKSRWGSVLRAVNAQLEEKK
ncbi:MAG: hypothetical protein GY799_30325 [Desulfobulbaceae bacterium]|nr:hypothetical protein [Desulfobulbaceae bacterium]